VYLPIIWETDLTKSPEMFRVIAFIFLLREGTSSVSVKHCKMFFPVLCYKKRY